MFTNNIEEIRENIKAKHTTRHLATLFGRVSEDGKEMVRKGREGSGSEFKGREVKGQ